MEQVDGVGILVVDDSEDLLELVGEVLRSKGYSVRTAVDGAAAMALIEESQPHCVILDVRMPRLDGHQFAKALRARHGDDIVLVAMSGYGPSDPEVAATFRIVDHYLRKPFDMEELDKIFPDLAPGA